MRTTGELFVSHLYKKKSSILDVLNEDVVIFAVNLCFVQKIWIELCCLLVEHRHRHRVPPVAKLSHPIVHRDFIELSQNSLFCGP